MSELEGRDNMFGNALNSIMENVQNQEAEEAKKNEASMKKGSKAEDPLKAKSPKDLSKEGEKDMKLHQLDAMGADVKSHATEGKVPEEGKDDEKTKIEKLTEESEVASDVEALVQKAKDALDAGDYDKVQDYTSRLDQIKMAAAEVKEEPVENPVPPVEEPTDVDVDVEEKKVNEDRIGIGDEIQILDKEGNTTVVPSAKVYDVSTTEPSGALSVEITGSGNEDELQWYDEDDYSIVLLKKANEAKPSEVEEKKDKDTPVVDLSGPGKAALEIEKAKVQNQERDKKKKREADA